MSRKQRQLILIFYDLLAFLVAFWGAYKFLNPLLVMDYRRVVLAALFTFFIYFVIAYVLHLFNKVVRYTSIRDAVLLGSSIGAAYILALNIFYLLGWLVSFRFIFLTSVITSGLIIGGRILWRIYVEHDLKRKRLYLNPSRKRNAQRTVVVGAGEGGALFIKRLLDDRSIHFVGLVDDAPTKQNTYIYSVPVLGKIDDLPTIIDQFQVDQVTIAIPSLSTERLNEIFDLTAPLEVKINQMPSLEDLMTGKYSINKFKEIDVADLLGREEVKLDMEVISAQTTENVILVSGAGGSIGSEICRQLVRFNPSQLLLLGHDEFAIYQIHRELALYNLADLDLVPIIADIKDRDRMDEIMSQYRPDRVYHAAAHKHVPMMEANPREAVKNNIYGTKNIAESAKAHGVQSFVMVSTDKAVNPPNVMGATKRVAEMIVTGLNEVGKTNFVAVRFGNVLNSSGSVIPVFKEQLKKGGPLTVTDFRMTRYFMTIPEASRLVLQAGALAQGGEIFVLDMGEPVKIYDLAEKIIQLSGYTVEEIGIQEIGIRQGEKLYEELLTDGEAVSEQIYDKIFVGNVTQRPIQEVMDFVDQLYTLDDQELVNRLIAYANKD